MSSLRSGQTCAGRGQDLVGESSIKWHRDAKEWKPMAHSKGFSSVIRTATVLVLAALLCPMLLACGGTVEPQATAIPQSKELNIWTWGIYCPCLLYTSPSPRDS